MQENPTPTAIERENTNDATILLVLLHQPACGPWAVEEIERELGHNPTDGIDRLRGAGLIHQHAGFVWASRAAVVADDIDM
jgi:hypothetical protein